jgi:hypothetical protein
MEDADTSEIENAFKHEPGLTLDLLRLTNSAASGLTTRITSLRHAIAVLGRRQLQRWLQLLIYANADSGKGPRARTPGIAAPATGRDTRPPDGTAWPNAYNPETASSPTNPSWSASCR